MAKKAVQGRKARREAQLEAAGRVHVPTACDVAVMGGGAAGLVCATAAAEAGASVVVLERAPECGLPILATGNGRCNFCNQDLDPVHYNDPAFVRAVCGKGWLQDVLGFFGSCGLTWHAEDGRLYPTSNQAASVRNVILARARRAGVVLAPAREVTRVMRGGEGCEVTFCEGFGAGKEIRLAAKALVVAAGNASLESLGGLGLEAAPLTPVLCPLSCEDSPLFALDGRRAHVRASLFARGAARPWHTEEGEVLFRSYGISGIVTFDLSRRANPGDLVTLDLAPSSSEEELMALVDPHGTGTFEQGCLDGVLDPVIAALLEKLARERWQVAQPALATLSTDAEALIALTKALPLVVREKTETERAQVMRGGLSNEQFDVGTLAHNTHRWLFACGEALDVDADCGGYNLAWAWKSGMVAGQSVAAQTRRQAC